MNDPRAWAIRRTSEILAQIITRMPEPDPRSPYSWNTCLLGRAFCEMDPGQADIEAVRLLTNLKISDPDGSQGPIRSRRIIRIYPLEDDLVALIINLN